jgi:hypothetical protein
MVLMFSPSLMDYSEEDWFLNLPIRMALNIMSVCARTSHHGSCISFCITGSF